jgi:hypothetical protein
MNLKKSGISVGFAMCLTIGIFVGLIANPIYQIVIGIVSGRHIQTLYAPETNRQAILLKKHNLADINFVVKVDGKRVYFSSDYVPYPDHLYRETLVWDKTGRIVVLELMGKRVFAYDAEEQRELEKGEIDKYLLYPVENDVNYAPIKDINEL